MTVDAPPADPPSPASNSARHRSLAVPLSWAWAVLIVYASLYPFEGWRSVSVSSPLDWLVLPWTAKFYPFDTAANLLGYLPLGGLIFIAALRSGSRSHWALLLAIGIGSLLSLSMEELQNFLPERVPSRLDWILNTAGTLAGASAAWFVHRTGGVEHWQALRDRWFVRRSAGALLLLLLWPVGLLFPPPLPLGLGHAIVRIPALAAAALDGTPLEAWTAGWVSARSDAPPLPLAPVVEITGILLGLLAPCLLAASVARPGWRRLALILGATAVGFATTTLSTALNFGPDHALAWKTPTVVPAFVLGTLVAASLAVVPYRVAAGLGLVALTGLVAVVAQVPADPYYAQSLQAWEQGRFIRFHGLAQWIGWSWPYAAMLFLLVKVSAHDGE